VSFVVGMDVGGTSTRAVVMDLDGVVVGRGSAGGGNPNSHPAELAAARIAAAVAGAFSGADSGAARHCVLGLAGVSKLTDPVVSQRFHAELAAVGLRCPVTWVSDAEVAFASATAEPDGTVLIGGTGSVAARIVGRRKVATIGGYGWLLGDEGSAYWIGREVVRATLDILLSSKEIGPLAGALLAEMSATTYEHVITAANAEAPIRLARFAPLVSAHADDPVAAQIIQEAASLLADHVRRAGGHPPVVLVGSVVGPGSPVGEALRGMLTGPVLYAADTATGAAWLAALEVLGPDAPRPRI
jgi:N-acetylglucosamine kinase-like BadF-type ATPase